MSKRRLPLDSPNWTPLTKSIVSSVSRPATAASPIGT